LPIWAEYPAVEVVAGRPELLASNIDVYSPCAIGGAVNDDTMEMLKARIACAGANNQLAHTGLDNVLAERGIVYAPDYLVNSGGVIQVADELEGFNFDRAKARAEKIFGTTRKILTIADDEG